MRLAASRFRYNTKTYGSFRRIQIDEMRVNQVLSRLPESHHFFWLLNLYNALTPWRFPLEPS
jgi:hypothetical protein